MASIPTPQEIAYQEAHITDDRSGSIIAANAACYAIGIIAVALRFLSRRISKIRYEWDDWLVVAGLFFTLGIVILDCWNLQYGSGRHAILLTEPALFAKGLIAAEVIYNFAITAIKGSLLYLYHRVFFVNRTFNYCLWAVGLFVAAYSLTQALAAIFQCMPIDSNWIVGKPHYCINTAVGATIIAAFNVLTDFAILIMPMPLLYKLQKPLKQKLQIMFMFMLGGFVCFASIYRTVVIHDLSHSDPSWSDVPVNIWTMVELNIGILSACLPTYRPLFHRKKGSSRTSSDAEKGGSRNNGNPSDQTLEGLDLQHSRSDPSQSKDFRHLGVLGDTHGHIHGVEEEEELGEEDEGRRHLARRCV